MTRARVVLYLVAVSALLTAPADAIGQIRPPARDVTAPSIGTASLSGIVLTDDTDHRPVRHASVSLSTGEIRLPMTAVTDDEGKFGFVNLPAGNYTLTASKSGYV